MQKRDIVNLLDSIIRKIKKTGLKIINENISNLDNATTSSKIFKLDYFGDIEIFNTEIDIKKFNISLLENLVKHSLLLYYLQY